MRGMKIMVLGTRGFPDVQGGVEKHCEQLYPKLVKLGCEVTVITRTPYIPKGKRLREWNGIRFIHIWAPKVKSLEAFVHTFLGILVARLRSPDILHIHSIGPALLVPFAKALGLKVIMTNHGPDYERLKWGGLARFMLKAGEFLGTMFADNVIAISEGIRKNIMEKYGRKDVMFIPNGVEHPDSRSPGEALKKYGLESKKYIFTACRFVPEKGLHDLIEAYCKIKDPGFRLVIAGDADHETGYSTRIKKMAGESSGITLTGFVSGEPLKELYSNSGLFVLPSYHEGLPISLLEALSYELPVLLSDIPANKEVPLPQSRYFRTGNVKELSENMVKLFDSGIDKVEREYYRRLLNRKYNWDGIATSVREIYGAVPEGRMVQ